MMNHRCHFCCPGCCISFCSYIKPQCRGATILNRLSCISFYSYIKPQHSTVCRLNGWVVYRSIPTSNRNEKSFSNGGKLLYIVLFLHQTATISLQKALRLLLYIVLFLHQTATFYYFSALGKRCISFYSYIKPQHRTRAPAGSESCISFYSYIKPQHFV